MYSPLYHRRVVIFTGILPGLWLPIQIVDGSAVQLSVKFVLFFLLIAVAAWLINMFFTRKHTIY